MTDAQAIKATATCVDSAELKAIKTNTVKPNAGPAKKSTLLLKIGAAVLLAGALSVAISVPLAISGGGLGYDEGEPVLLTPGSLGLARPTLRIDPPNTLTLLSNAWQGETGRLLVRGKSDILWLSSEAPQLVAAQFVNRSPGATPHPPLYTPAFSPIHPLTELPTYPPTYPPTHSPTHPTYTQQPPT